MGDIYRGHWMDLRNYLMNYKKKMEEKNGDYAAYGRYCIAMSIDDILKKMSEIEEN